MNETLKTLITRRSIRKFKSDMIPEDILNQILLAGEYAPTAKNMQDPIIIAITNKEMRDKISKLNAEIMHANMDPFYNAPVIVLVICKKSPLAEYDGSCVMSNLMNAAWSLGIGSCWIHRAKEEMETPFGKELLKSLNIEGEYVGIGHVALGYIDGNIPQEHPRKENYTYYIK